MHDGHVSVDVEEQGVGHGGHGEQVGEPPGPVIHEGVDVFALDLPGEISHDWRDHHADAEVYQVGGDEQLGLIRVYNLLVHTPRLTFKFPYIVISIIGEKKEC